MANRNMRDRTPALNFDDARLPIEDGDNSVSLREAMHDADLLDFNELYELDIPGSMQDAYEPVSYDQQGEELG